MTSFGEALSRQIDQRGRAEALVRLGACSDGPKVGQAGSQLRSFLSGVAEAAPYLARLMERHDVDAVLERPEDDALGTRFLSDIDAGDAARDLRRAKEQAHLALALGDLSGLWSMSKVTADLSDFADAAVEAALRSASTEVPGDAQGGSVSGITLIAMGKLGARELNYSSDIDLIAVFDAERMDVPAASRLGAKGVAVRIVQRLASILSDRTADGYVFRTDFRLRPDPSSTSVAVSLAQAERYYEQYGQNWERAAHIKARACAGDRDVGDAYLAMIRPFVWRRTLDYWALSDVRAIKAQIHAKVGNPDIRVPGGDVKLGPGGIREVEFFAQTQQLILGGRDPSLRVRGTLDALRALSAAGHVAPDVAANLATDYTTLRDVEHRIQMRQDEASQTLPAEEAHRRPVATLFGEEDLAAFDAGIAATLHRIHDTYADLFEVPGAEQVAPGSLVFTGVDDDPRTVGTLNGMGFSDAGAIIGAVRGWHQGTLAATRSVRARELLTALVPHILAAAARTDDPDTAFARMSQLLAGLPSGVQLFSLFTAHPEALEDVVTLCAASPMLAQQLSGRPSLVEALLGDDEPPVFPNEPSLEGAMDAARRVVSEGRLRHAAELTLGRADPDAVGAALSDLADGAVTLLSEKVRDALRASGVDLPPFCILAFGRLGVRSLTVTSDLDLVFVYDGPPEASEAVLKRVRRLVAALSAPTGQGVLYEIDMKLRPSGGAGPAAVSLSAFNRYHHEAAWMWEAMALTKARVILTEGDLGTEVEAVIEDVLAKPRDPAEVAAAVRDMRGRLLEGQPPRSPLDVKRIEGGLTDTDFLAQYLALTRQVGAERPPRATRAALAYHADAGALSADLAAQVGRAHSLFEAVAQYSRATFGAVPPAALTAPQERRLRQLPGIDGSVLEEVEAAAAAVRAALDVVLPS
ncbi:bifunctional [glutamine synthetase] adenylyltransferase/[glutamine synthetase]-adenylyl-L-tyrosine phosphorylase [Parvularcula dongshanensis]|uniref:Glutamate-ammonia-ligase adenylyltransferase n=1 Tax=Parvularcula dongshanensis TaxID=1173995 RepID=A0A840I2P9_9PROT|nr:bifunctional [glutamine synthetase] adenylyltransferase/[glutamine synthetase]-adenylyl-L-tyrosine phosphorylase [Parvularcula dongshanensis]MBB4658553.1 glutamate-ammonia-ligase adenylyltransferase [Parvularcula dongshanensis]